jgi:hypothetical protein
MSIMLFVCLIQIVSLVLGHPPQMANLGSSHIDPKISQAIPSISSSRRLSLNPWQSWQILGSHTLWQTCISWHIMTYHDISWHIMTYHDICIIKCQLHTFIDHTRWSKLECIGIWQNILPLLNLDTVSQLCSKDHQSSLALRDGV